MGATKRFIEGKWRYVHEDGTLGMPCAPPTEDELREFENQEQRRKYQEQADATGREVWWRGERFVPVGLALDPQPDPGRKLGTHEYKVITQRDEFFAGKFDPAKLEDLVNKLAADGWRVVSVATADVSTFWGSFSAGRGARQEIIVFMERVTK